MVKLTISLPNNTQITLESDEFDVINQVLSMLLPASANEAVSVSVPTASTANGHNGAVEKGTDATIEQPPAPQQSNGASHPQGSNGQHSNGALTHDVPEPQSAAPATGNMFSPSTISSANDPEDDGLFLEAQTPESREDFTAFCQNVNPMGDMRRVVVAAEGATRFFKADGVNADELGELFDLAGWRRANSFTQTLRNAARSKFGWLERIPGRSGRYAATELGRSVTLSG